MNTLNQLVAGNIRKLREKNKLSLDDLSRISGVSKSMLAQIEHGQGNPTLSTLWKIANGMQVPFDRLIQRPEQPVQQVKLEDIQPIREDEGRVRNYSLFPDTGNRRFAVYYLELEPGGFLESSPHLSKTEEFITVFSGSLEIRTGDHVVTLQASESLRFPGDTFHSYRNTGPQTVQLHMILYNPQ